MELTTLEIRRGLAPPMFGSILEIVAAMEDALVVAYSMCFLMQCNALPFQSMINQRLSICLSVCLSVAHIFVGDGYSDWHQIRRKGGNCEFSRIQ